ncbi:hypothetical protein FOL47_000279 [Perkinsus chesapeaki]|uniref:Uncharacterized protein n=1 Tax=Perkinsus chesapeaki TaxID=330153 RepID=A0A7J6MM24_PERCH|nr:hypothetical protein FOL47_000279 [Perkinsus chesapeaki]
MSTGVLRHILNKVARETNNNNLRNTLLRVADGIKTASQMAKMVTDKVREYKLDKPETDKAIIAGLCLSLFEESLTMGLQFSGGTSDKRLMEMAEEEGKEAYSTMIDKLLNLPSKYMGDDGIPIGNGLRLLTGVSYMALRKKGLSRHVDFIMKLVKVFDYPICQ